MDVVIGYFVGFVSGAYFARKYPALRDAVVRRFRHKPLGREGE